MNEGITRDRAEEDRLIKAVKLWHKQKQGWRLKNPPSHVDSAPISIRGCSDTNKTTMNYTMGIDAIPMAHAQFTEGVRVHNPYTMLNDW